MLSCLYRQNWTPQGRLLLVLLIGIGFGGNLMSVHLFDEFHYLFGSIAALVALRLYGVLWGAVTALVAASYTIVLAGHPYALLWFGLEPLAVGYLTSRWPVRNIVIADAIYWPLVGGPLLLATSHFVLHIDTQGMVTAFLLTWAIGIANSLIASLITDHLPLHMWIGDKDSTSPISVHHLLFNLFMTIILIPALIVMGHSVRRSGQEDVNTISDYLHDTRQVVSYELRLKLSGYNGEMQELLDFVEYADHKITDNVLSETAHHAFEEFSDITTVKLLNRYHKALLAIPAHEAERTLTRDEMLFFSSLPANNQIMISPYLRPATPQSPPELTMATGYSSGNHQRGIIAISLAPNALQSLIRGLELHRHQQVTVRDANNRVILTTRPGLTTGDFFDPNLKRTLTPVGIGVQRSSPAQDADMTYWEQAEQTVYVSDAIISPEIPWILTVEAPYGAFRREMLEELTGKLAGLIGICYVALIMSLSLANRLTAPLQHLSLLTTDLPTKLAQRKEMRWPGSSILEMDSMINNFRTMAKALDEKFSELATANATLEDRVTERTRELTEANAFLSLEIRDRMKAEDERDNYLTALQQQLEFLETLMESIPNPVFFKDRQGHYLGCNEAFLHLSGLNKEDLIGKTVHQIYPEDLADFYQRADDSLLRLGGTQQYETVLLEKGAVPRDVILYKATFGDAENKVAGLVGVVLDITERKLIEAERDQLLQELTQNNKELEGIVYAASHDLRSPLINIEGFSRKLAKSCNRMETLLSPEAETSPAVAGAITILRDEIPKALGFINSSTEKMDLLLKGLLRLSRLGRQALLVEQLDMDQLMEQVTAAMSFQLQNCGATITIDPLPGCLGDRVQINQALSNLLDNAVKYRSPDRLLSIRISGKRDGAMTTYRVEDNGIGIAKEHQDKVWDIFHRVNPKGTEGEGLGLAIVRRIIDRNGGIVRIESVPGVGTTFIISLPALPSKRKRQKLQGENA